MSPLLAPKNPSSPSAAVFLFFVGCVVKVADEVGLSPGWHALAGILLGGDRLAAIDTCIRLSLFPH